MIGHWNGKKWASAYARILKAEQYFASLTTDLTDPPTAEEANEVGSEAGLAPTATPVKSAPPTPVIDSLSELPPSGPSNTLMSIHQVFELQLPKTATPGVAPIELDAAADVPSAKPTDAPEEVAAEPMEAADEAEEPVETEASLMKLLVKDLRAMCSARGLAQAGKKAELVERLLTPGGAAEPPEPAEPPTPAALEPAASAPLSTMGSTRRSTRRTAV